RELVEPELDEGEGEVQVRRLLQEGGHALHAALDAVPDDHQEEVASFKVLRDGVVEVLLRAVQLHGVGGERVPEPLTRVGDGGVVEVLVGPARQLVGVLDDLRDHLAARIGAAPELGFDGGVRARVGPARAMQGAAVVWWIAGMGRQMAWASRMLTGWQGARASAEEVLEPVFAVRALVNVPGTQGAGRVVAGVCESRWRVVW